MDPIQLVKNSLSHTEQHTRLHARCSVVLPLRLTTGSGEIIPAVVLNVSPSGLLILVDERTSLILPPPRGTQVDSEFFFDELEVPKLTLEIIRIDQRKNHQLALGCKFVNLSPHVAAAIRAKVQKHLSASRPHK